MTLSRTSIQALAASPVGAEGITVDEALRAVEARYRTILDSIDEGFCTVEVLFDQAGTAIDYRFLEVNQAFERQTGLVNAAGKRMRELAPGHEEHWFQIYGRVALTGEPIRFENPAEALGRWYDVYAFRVGDPEHRTVAILFSDITVRKSAERALREAEGTLRGVFDATGALMAVLEMESSDFVHAMVNGEAARFFGRRVEEVVGKTGLELGFPKEAVTQWLALLRQCHTTQAPMTLELPVLRGSEDVWIHATLSTVPMGPSGRPRFAVVAVDVTKQRRIEEALRESVRRKTHFLAILSHELRNPLAPIQNSLQLLERSPEGSPQSAHAREVIRRQVDHLTRLVEDLLDMSRITHDKITLERDRLDAREVVRRACEDVRHAFEERGLALRLDLSSAPLWVDADPTRLAQIVGNLLANALKFTPPSGVVDVTLRDDHGDLELRVRDTGSGIEPHLLEEIFEPFAQAERTRGTARGGIGIGLALVKSLVALHGGAVRAQSRGSGHGAEFIVTLPLAPALAVAPTPSPRPPVRSLDILIVEDNRDAGETLADLLGLEGHRTRLAEDGRSGLAAAEEALPDVLICDVGLPDANGYDLVRKIRQLAGAHTVFAVALTGYAQPEDIDLARAAGFDAHLAKPQSMERLDALLAEAAAKLR
jgi:PAS domain S-box-containing protein